MATSSAIKQYCSAPSGVRLVVEADRAQLSKLLARRSHRSNACLEAFRGGLCHPELPIRIDYDTHAADLVTGDAGDVGQGLHAADADRALLARDPGTADVDIGVTRVRFEPA